MGECAIPADRLKTYFLTARDRAIPTGSSDCVIHQHFVATPHSLNDIQITLVEAVPPTRPKRSFLYMHAIRKRLEARWIQRLGAVLNKQRAVHALMSGGAAARSGAAEDLDD